jgi:hypothetical protein
MQRFAPLPPVIHVPARPIDPDHLVAFIDVLQPHAERERIQRAIAQYVEALRRWNSGHEIMCVAHLYMGIEALTKSLLRSEKSKLGVDDLGLAAAWNIKITKSDTSKLDLNKLDGEVRRRLIFQGDDECFSKVKSVSDGFEHGFAGYATMQQPARETVSKAATYLRTAIVKLLAPSGKMDLILTDRNWAEPRGPIALSKKIRGKLKGNVDALAIMGNPYPQLVWRSSLKTVRIEADGRYGYAPQEQFDPQLGEGTELQLGSIEVWDDTVMTSNVSAASKAIAPTPMEVVITRKQQKWRKKIGNFIRGLGHLIQELFAD